MSIFSLKKGEVRDVENSLARFYTQKARPVDFKTMQKPVRMRKKGTDGKTFQSVLGLPEKERKDRIKTPWVLSDETGKVQFTGKIRGMPQSKSKYYVFLREPNSKNVFRVVPLNHWYVFEPSKSLNVNNDMTNEEVTRQMKTNTKRQFIFNTIKKEKTAPEEDDSTPSFVYSAKNADKGENVDYDDDQADDADEDLELMKTQMENKEQQNELTDNGRDIKRVLQRMEMDFVDSDEEEEEPQDEEEQKGIKRQRPVEFEVSENIKKKLRKDLDDANRPVNREQQYLDNEFREELRKFVMVRRQVTVNEIGKRFKVLIQDPEGRKRVIRVTKEILKEHTTQDGKKLFILNDFA